MTTLFDSRKWSSNPVAYWSIQYEYQRNGANMQYRFHWKIWFNSSNAWYNNILVIPIILNNVTVANITAKPKTSGSGLGPYSGVTDWFELLNVTSGTIPFKSQLVDIGFGTGWNVKDTSLDYNLNVAPAYTTINTFNVNKVNGIAGITSVNVEWSTAHIIDYLWYSVDNGINWIGLDIVDDISGNFNINNLQANSGYNFKIKVRRKDSQLSIESGTDYQSTYNINTIFEVPDSISNGNILNIKANNPSGANCNIRLETIINGVTENRFTKNGTDITFTIEEINSLLAFAPNNSKFVVRVVADTLNGNEVIYHSWQDLEYIIINSNPIFESFDYFDSNNSVSSVTENNKTIVKNHSNLRITISSLNKMITKNSSTPLRYEITVANRSGTINYSDSDTFIDLGTINVSGNIFINVNAVDSRGFKTLCTKEIIVVDYSEPVLNTILGRVNNFEKNTTIIAKGTYSTVDDKNQISTVEYRYKEKSISSWDNVGWNNFEVLQENGEYTTNSVNLEIDNQTSFDFQVRVIDKIATVGILENYDLDEGIPIQFINATKKNIGIGCLNESGEEYSLEVLNSIKTNKKFIMKSGNEVLDYEIIDTW